MNNTPNDNYNDMKSKIDMAEKQIAEMKAMLASMSTENEDQPKPQTTENQS